MLTVSILIDLHRLARELLLRPTASDEKLEDVNRSHKKTNLSNRRSSFFRRKKPHRSNSKDSRDFSEGSISDVAMHDGTISMSLMVFGGHAFARHKCSLSTMSVQSKILVRNAVVFYIAQTDTLTCFSFQSVFDPHFSDDNLSSASISCLLYCLV